MNTFQASRIVGTFSIAVGVLISTAVAQGPVRPLADDFVVLHESPNPGKVYCYSPALAVCPSGRIVATIDLGGPGVKDLPGLCGKVFTSDDHGRTWTHRGDFPFYHARPFVVGKSIYVLGHRGDLMVIRSDDRGQTWTEPKRLTEGERWHGSGDNYLCAGDYVYLAMEKLLDRGVRGWPVASMAPVLLRGKIGADLTQRKNWTFASELVFVDNVDYRKLEWFGVPFLKMDAKRYVRGMAPIGWLEANVARIVDPDHYWHDPAGKTFHLLMRAHTGGVGYAAMVKVVENDDGSMTTMFEQAPSGKKMVYVQMPGGQMKFHIVYDKVTKLYWLLSSQATDSMTRADRLPKERYNLPNNERHRLQLHFSKNLVDWCFAGLVSAGGSPKQSRHYASMAIDGDNLIILSRSGDHRAKSAHDGNLTTFHTVRNFRELVY